MRSISPKTKSGGAANATRLESYLTETLTSHIPSVNHTHEQWRREASRLLAEYGRTGNPEHLKAFRVHRAAMGARLRRREAGR